MQGLLKKHWIVLYSYSPGVKHGFQQCRRPRNFWQMTLHADAFREVAHWAVAHWKMIAERIIIDLASCIVGCCWLGSSEDGRIDDLMNNLDLTPFLYSSKILPSATFGVSTTPLVPSWPDKRTPNVTHQHAVSFRLSKQRLSKSIRVSELIFYNLLQGTLWSIYSALLQKWSEINLLL